MMQERKKISIAYFSDAPYTGGAEKYLYELASNLDPDRFDRYVIINNRRSLARLESWLSGSGIKVVSLGYEPPFSIFKSRSLFRALQRFTADIFHINLPGSYDAGYGIAAPVAKTAGVKHIITTEHLPMYPSFAKGRLFKKFAMRSIDLVLTVSDDNRKHLIKNHGIAPEKIEVIYNGISSVEKPEKKITGDKVGRFVVAVIGALHRRKGHFTIFDAIKDLPENIRLVVAGEGDMEEEYREYVRDNKLDQRVEFIGHCKDIGKLLAETDLLAVPSTLEATPYVILEAMSAGIPVVASRIFGIPELVIDGETGILVEPGESAIFAKAIGSLASDSATYNKMTERSKNLFEDRFTIERSVARTQEIYEKQMGSTINKAGEM